MVYFLQGLEAEKAVFSTSPSHWDSR